MKCGACGYRYKHMEDNMCYGDELISDGEERFEQIFGHFYRVDRNTYEEQTVYLLSCPKCGTIRMEKFC